MKIKEKRPGHGWQKEKVVLLSLLARSGNNDMIVKQRLKCTLMDNFLEFPHAQQTYSTHTMSAGGRIRMKGITWYSNPVTWCECLGLLKKLRWVPWVARELRWVTWLARELRWVPWVARNLGGKRGTKIVFESLTFAEIQPLEETRRGRSVFVNDWVLVVLKKSRNVAWFILDSYTHGSGHIDTWLSTMTAVQVGRSLPIGQQPMWNVSANNV